MNYRRIILKVSGEALFDEATCYAFSLSKAENLVCEIKKVVSKYQLAIVVGAGNFFRGEFFSKNSGISRVAGDQLGMMSTMLNGIFLREIFAKHGLRVKLVSALSVEGVIERYLPDRVSEYLDSGYLVIMTGGTGNPMVTTDTALCLRGVELKADLVLKATHKVDGVYSADPTMNDGAELYHQLSYDFVLSKNLKIMDRTAFLIGKEQRLTLGIYNFNKPGALENILEGKVEGTIIR